MPEGQAAFNEGGYRAQGGKSYPHRLDQAR